MFAIPLGRDFVSPEHDASDNEVVSLDHRRSERFILCWAGSLNEWPFGRDTTYPTYSIAPMQRLFGGLI